MAKCTYCSKETQLYINGMPICPSCDADIEAGRTPPSSPAKAAERSIAYQPAKITGTAHLPSRTREADKAIRISSTP
jgi:hypothetical protein